MGDEFYYDAIVGKFDFELAELDLNDVIIDSSSFWVLIDKGGRDYCVRQVRLYGLEAPRNQYNMDGGDTKSASIAIDFLRKRLVGNYIRFKSNKLDQIGRMLVTVWDRDDVPLVFETSLNHNMIEQGIAKKFEIVKRDARV